MELPLNILTRLYRIQSKSGQEAQLIKYLESLLPLLGENITIKNINNNLYITKGECISYPCIVAHSDQIQEPNKNIEILQLEDLYVGFDFKNKKQVGLGADDKNGIFMIILALIQCPILKACIFHGEEIGCIGSTACEMTFFDDCRFVLQCDRRNSGDFINNGAGTELCSKEFINDCLLEEFGYQEVNGSITDVVTLKQRGLKISCCNISCGYYNPHTSQEVTKISDLEKCWTFVQHILSLDKTYAHEYAPKVYKPEKYPVLKAPIKVPTLKFQNLYAKKLCKDNPNLTSVKMVELWLDNYQKIPLIPLTKFKDIYNATHNQLLSK
jgi:hypothetical protein